MQVTKTKDLGGGHLIEVGSATWDEGQLSIRNRYTTPNVEANVRGVSEISSSDLSELMMVAADEDLIASNILTQVQSAVSASLNRQSS